MMTFMLLSALLMPNRVAKIHDHEIKKRFGSEKKFCMLKLNYLPMTHWSALLRIGSTLMHFLKGF